MKFYERKEIKDVLAYLRLIVNPNDNMSLQRIINVPRRGFGPINIARLSEFAAQNNLSIFEVISKEENLRHVPQLSPRIRQRLREFAAMIISLGESQRNYNLADFINTVLDETGYMAMLKEGDDAQKPENLARIENIGEFVNSATDFTNTTDDATLEEFLNHVALLTDLDEVDEGESRVSLMTIHSAKGLEFSIVFIVGMEEGLLPHANSMADPEKMEEERRICYVAMTRAKKKLYFTAAEERKTFGRSYDTKISQFLAEIPRECISGVSEKNSTSEISHHITTASTKHSSGSKNLSVSTVTTSVAWNYQPKVPDRPKVDWKVGDQLKHKKWGTGTVISVDGDYLRINFANIEIGEKVLKANAAPIEKTVND